MIRGITKYMRWSMFAPRFQAKRMDGSADVAFWAVSVIARDSRAGMKHIRGYPTPDTRCPPAVLRGGCELVKEGAPAPDFDLEADDGTRVSLASLRGRNVVLFFYPKDNTSG